MHYWDTSSLAKLYVAEADSLQFSTHWSQTGVITSSELARWELFCVLARKEADGLIPSGAAEIIFNEFLADVTSGAVVLISMREAEENQFRNLVLRLSRLKPPLFARTLDGFEYVEMCDSTWLDGLSVRKASEMSFNGEVSSQKPKSEISLYTIDRRHRD